MSVALLVKDTNAKTSLVPVATEATYRAVWQAGAKALELKSVAAMQWGIDIPHDALADVLEEFRMLRGWFEASEYSSEIERLDRVVNALKAVRFDAGETAWIG